MTITEVAWVRGSRGTPVLELRLDGHRFHILSGQKAELIRRGIVEGRVLLASDRTAQRPDQFVHGDYRPEYDGLDLIDCTDDPAVLGEYRAMCDAIRADRWAPGPRPQPS